MFYCLQFVIPRQLDAIFLPLKPRFYLRAVLVGFVVWQNDTVACFSLNSCISPVIHSFILITVSEVHDKPDQPSHYYLSP
jgi:hypothetical protein